MNLHSARTRTIQLNALSALSKEMLRSRDADENGKPLHRAVVHIDAPRQDPALAAAVERVIGSDEDKEEDEEEDEEDEDVLEEEDGHDERLKGQVRA